MDMQQKMTFAGAAALALAAAMAVPGYAAVHHRVHHRTAHQASQSTPAERQQTADLNRQQLAQAQANTGGMNVGSTSTGTAIQQNGLTTEPTSYQRSGKPTGLNGSAPSSMGSQPGSETGAVQTPADAAPGTGAQSNPDGAMTPPPVNPSGGSQ
jgi:hypothetical protein